MLTRGPLSQALTLTPRGGTIPHLLLTPRLEHLYEESLPPS